MLSGVLSVIDGGCKIASSHSPLAVTEVELGGIHTAADIFDYFIPLLFLSIAV